MESAETADARGAEDIALISLMRDTMLRVSEVAVLTWHEFEVLDDQTGRLHIQRSKTDVEGQGAVDFVARETVKALNGIRLKAEDGDSIFGLGSHQISRRIKRAAEAAGIGYGFSGHSPRIGMARDLARCSSQARCLQS